jgi:hypothetical protein
MVRSSFVQAKRPILCDGETIQIEPNLHDALLQLRQINPGDYWIDGICIHQEDIEERSQQVQMMGRIYSSADLVTVWLGTYSSLLSSGMKKLLVNSPADLPGATVVRSRLRVQDVSKNMSLFTLLSASIVLLTRKWFSRLWVVQELCLAREVTFFLGEDQFDADTLGSAYLWISDLMDREYWEVVYRIDAMKALNQGTHVKHLPLSLKMRESLSEGGKLTLEEWIELCRGRQAKDARDMLYGGLSLIRPDLLSIHPGIQLEEEAPLPPRPGVREPSPRPAPLKRRSSKSPKLWAALRADYNADAREVFFNLAACQLSQPTCTNLLSMASRYRDTGFGDFAKDGRNLDANANALSISLPSWVPCLGSWDSSILPTFASLGGTFFSACTQLRNNPKISPDATTLFLDAAILDVVEERTITGRRSFVKSSPYGLESPLGFLEDVLRLRREYAPTTESQLMALANTLTAGIWNGSDDSDEPLPRKEEKIIGFCQHVHYLVRSEVKKLQEVEEPAPTVAGLSYRLEERYLALRAAYSDAPWPPENEDLQVQVKPLMEQFRTVQESTFSWRSVLTTANGYLVLGPGWVREGDVVMLVKGGRLPYILTRRDEYLRREISSRQKVLGESNKGGLKKSGKNRSDIEGELAELQKQVGQSDTWILVGEAYVEGFMYEEGLQNSDLQFNRIGIV